MTLHAVDADRHTAKAFVHKFKASQLTGEREIKKKIISTQVAFFDSVVFIHDLHTAVCRLKSEKKKRKKSAWNLRY